MYHSREPLGVIGFNRSLIVCTFFPNGGSAVSNASNKGKGFTVARTSQGLFTITLDYFYNQITSVTASVQSVTAAARWAQVGVIVPTSRTIQVRTVDAAGAVQDCTADANTSISVTICVRASGNEY
jgi:hypothetical protein